MESCKLILPEKGKIQTLGGTMERTYKQIELIGISEESYEQAIRNAISKASQSLRGINWYEVMEQRGRVVDGKVTEYQVIIKVAFKLE